MTKDTKLSELVINKLTKMQYDGIATKDPNQLYIVTDAAGFEESRTNCITYIPQDIKLELKDGTLTLKSGSKVYVPYGSSVFNTITTTKDVSATRVDSQDCMVWYYADGRLGIFPKVLVYSGATAPTQYQFMYWYDTTENKCKISSDFGSTWTAGLSFPICVVETDGTKISAIKQVFNGFGYVASIVFALPGVKGLIANGRNEDGTLRNIEFKLDEVLIKTISLSGQPQIMLLDDALNKFQGPAPATSIAYDEINNYTLYSGSRQPWIPVIVLSGSSGVINSFQPKTPFHALDYNDKETIVGWGKPSNKRDSLTLGASGSKYVAPGNGWFCVSKVSTGSGQYINLINATAEIRMSTNPANGIYGYVNVPAKTGDNVFVHYSLGGVTEFFIFVYAEGEK